MEDVKGGWLLSLLTLLPLLALEGATVTSAYSSSYASPTDAFYYDRTANTTSTADAAFTTWPASSREASSDPLIPALIRHLESLGELAQRACLSLSQECDRRINDIRELEAKVIELQETNQALQIENEQLQNTTQGQQTVIRELQTEVERLQNLTLLAQRNVSQYSRDVTSHLQTTIEDLLRREEELNSRVRHYGSENAELHQKIHQLHSHLMWRESELETHRQRILELEDEVGVGYRRSEEEEIEATNHISSIESSVPFVRTPWDCTEAMRGGKPNGVYTIFPRGGGGGGVRVRCHRVDGRVWTVILHRHNQTIPHEDFARSWPHYKHGFGDPATEYWIGNDHLHDLTGNNVNYSLRVEATNLKGEIRSGEWPNFRVRDEANRYRVSLSAILPQSELGDALNTMDGAAFTTHDRDHDTSKHRNCAVSHGGGWWYHGCSLAFPTAPHSPPEGPTNGITKVLNWAFFGPRDSGWVALSKLTMMIANAA